MTIEPGRTTDVAWPVTVADAAYGRLISFEEGLAGRAGDDVGAWHLPDGDRYYTWTLRHYTTTDLSPDSLHALGLGLVARARFTLGLIRDWDKDHRVPISELLREFGTLRIAFYAVILMAFIVFKSEGLMVYGQRKYHQFERWVKI